MRQFMLLLNKRDMILIVLRRKYVHRTWGEEPDNRY